MGKDDSFNAKEHFSVGFKKLMQCAVLKLKGVLSGMIVQKLFVDVKFAPSRFSWGKT